MDVRLESGRYVIAVSGGVDSMVLLDLLRQHPDIKLIVAHYDHGIRPDSAQDRRLVQAYAKKHGLQFVYDEGKLGPNASEQQSRKARYDFLNKVKKASKAHGIITAHHHDDVLETALINLIRGTNRRGLSSLRSSDNLHRPLARIAKSQLRTYAKQHNIVWSEDVTNTDPHYLRNRVRHNLIPKLTISQRTKLANIVDMAGRINDELDSLLVNYLHTQPSLEALDRRAYARLPHPIAREIMAAWLRHRDIKQLDKKMLERLVVAAKTHSVGKRIDIVRGYQLQVGKDELALFVKTDGRLT